MRIILFLFFMSITTIHAQYGYWQQKVDYKMDIDMDVQNNTYTGVQKLQYTNNSPDTLTKAYYHLYFNAFQPGSDMDIRNQLLPDSDPRVAGRIEKLSKREIGYHKIESLTMDGVATSYEVNGTILEVDLPSGIVPGQTVTFDMVYNSQVPLQIRRSGRDNAEGIRYSMSQWYPKICEYDYMGWHPNPYIGREFHSPWGDWEVNISIDKSYTIGATGTLVNANQIGHGYQPVDIRVPEPETEKITWNFKAENVIDFVWAADPEYRVLTRRAHDRTLMYFVFQPNEATVDNWNALPKILDEALRFMNERYGKYPYDRYSFIQGGDGGMEYPMATLITGERKLKSLVGVSVHEWMHSWYQFMLASNEALYAWMDEGFTSFATNEVMNHLVEKGLLQGEVSTFPHERSYNSYIALANSGKEEALITHADHFSANAYYGIAAYSKGNVFLNQMQYIIGKETFDVALKDYFNTWKYKHPTSYDFIRQMEKQSGMVLDWYQEYFVNSTKTIDYAVESVESNGFGKVSVNLTRVSDMPMPLDVEVTYKNGDTEIFHIPLDLMRGNKTSSESILYNQAPFNVMDDWHWVNPTYELNIDKSIRKVSKVDINPSRRMADVNPDNNVWVKN